MMGILFCQTEVVIESKGRMDVATLLFKDIPIPLLRKSRRFDCSELLTRDSMILITAVHIWGRQRCILRESICNTELLQESKKVQLRRK